MRDTFIKHLVNSAIKNEKIFLIVGDLGFSVIEDFQERFPDRFLNAGVAEQNMAGTAAGLASEGYHVFIYSIANFPTFRCAEQIRNDIDYHNLPVTVVSVGGGLSYGNLGYSHHAVQDYGLMRLFPNMSIYAPGDPVETLSCLNYILSNPSPSYLRLGRSGEETFHKQLPKIQPGKWVKLIESKNKRILLSTGAALSASIKLHQSNTYNAYVVYTLPAWGMKHKQDQWSQISEFEHIVTVEDHLHDCGFGSWLLESVQKKSGLANRIDSIYLDSKVCGIVGSQDYLNNLGGLYER